MNAFNELATLIQTGWTQEANARELLAGAYTERFAGWH
jgi:hypothetical protein